MCCIVFVLCTIMCLWCCIVLFVFYCVVCFIVFFVDKLIKNKIQVVYIIKPLWGDDNVLETILDNNCLKKTSLTNILDSYFLENCKSLEN